MLGDQQFSLYAASISQYRTLSFSYLNLAHRFNYAMQGYSQTQFFYGTLENVFYDPSFSGSSTATSRSPRAPSAAERCSASGRSTAIGASRCPAECCSIKQSFNDPALQDYSQQYQQTQFGRQLFRSGTYLPLGITFVQETTVFREFGPLAGNTMRVSYENAPPVGSSSRVRPLDIDARYYQRLGATGLLALRARGFQSWGDAPDFMYFGGNSEMRGYDYLQFVGDTRRSSTPNCASR